MNEKKVMATLVVFLLLGTLPVYAAIASTSSTSDSYVYAERTGQLTWSINPVQFQDFPSPPSSTALILDKYQKKNVNDRMGELLVRFAEEYYKNQLLNLVLINSMLLDTSLLTTLVNSNIVVWDAFGNEVYNANHVQMVQTSQNCPTGTVCFNGKMYSSSGSIIQTGQVKIFPTTTTNIVILDTSQG